jgi:hypothetical protein
VPGAFAPRHGFCFARRFAVRVQTDDVSLEAQPAGGVGSFLVQGRPLGSCGGQLDTGKPIRKHRHISPRSCWREASREAVTLVLLMESI